MNGSDISEHKQVGDAFAKLKRRLYDLGHRAQVKQSPTEWEARFRSYAGEIDEAFRELRSLLRKYDLDRGSLGKYLQELEGYENRLETYGDKYRGTASEIAYKMIKIAETVQNYVNTIDSRRRAGLKTRLDTGTVIIATVAIILLSIVGLASFLYVQAEPTARVVSPTVANLPLGIVFLAILVIGIIAMPRLRH